MAERRMFAKSVVETDRFYDMRPSAQALYFHLGMHADDDGFLSNARAIQMTMGSKAADLKCLIDKGYLIQFSDGLIVVRHWLMNNFIRSDRYRETPHAEEKNMLLIESGKPYELVNSSSGIPNGYQTVTASDTQYSIGKDSIEKGYIYAPSGKKKDIPSSVDEVWEYAQKLNAEKGLSISIDDCETFLDYYAARGWNFNKGTPIKDWQSAFRNWVRNSHKFKSESPASNQASRKTLDREKEMLADLGIKV